MKPCALQLFLRAWLAAISALVLASCGGGDGDSGGGSATLNPPASTQAAATELVDAYAATLSGAAETPSTGSTAQGSATVVVDPATRQALVTVTTSGIADTAVQIRAGTPGATGPAIVTLTETADSSGVWTARTTLTPEQHSALQAGNFYVEVSSTAFPNGEIRGQIAPQQAAAGTTGSAATSPLGTGGNNGLILPSNPSTTTFISSLKGAQQVPPVPSAGRAAGSATVNPATRQLVAAVNTFGVQATAVQIQEGAAGENGPLLISLTETSMGSGNWVARTTLTDAQYNALVQGNLYFNVLSAAFPAGELRGQLLPQARFVANPLQPAGGTSTGIGSAIPVVPVTGTVTPSGIGTGSPIPVVPITGTATPSSIDTGVTGTIPVTPATITPGIPGTGATPAGLNIGIGTPSIGTLTPPSLGPSVPPLGATTPAGTGTGFDTGIGTGTGIGIDTGLGTATPFGTTGTTGTTVPGATPSMVPGF